MGFSERKKLYQELEEYRRHPVISYVTSSRENAGGIIANDAIRQFVKQLEYFTTKPKEIDLLINSNGGDGLTSWRLITLLREYLGKDGKITCLVPFNAFSAATLLAVGCDEIFMHPWACLGPVDPQITVNKKEGPQQFAYEDVSAYTNFLKEEAGIRAKRKSRAFITTCYPNRSKCDRQRQTGFNAINNNGRKAPKTPYDGK
jgi:ClpP class serine protease